MDAQRILIITSALLAMVCIGLGLQLYQTNQTVVAVQADNTAISFERDQVLFDLEKLSFSYDTPQHRKCADARPNRRSEE